MALSINNREIFALTSCNDIEPLFAKIFDANAAVHSENESILYIKKFIAISSSLFLYQRNAFSHNDYRKFAVCDGHVKLNLLCPNKSSSVSAIIDQFMGAFDEIDKKYLENLSLIINYNMAGKEISEVLTYEFDYQGENPIKLSITGGNEIIKLSRKSTDIVGETKSLLRKIEGLCDRLNIIPEDGNTSIRMMAKRNSTAPERAIRPAEPIKGTLVEERSIGNIDTGYHRVNVKFNQYEN